MLFKKHIVYSELKRRGVESFDYSYFRKIFQANYNDINIQEKTKEMYCSKLYNWFVRLGLFEETRGRVTMVNTPNAKMISLNMQRTSRRGRYQCGNANLFWGQSSLDKFIVAYNQISSKNTGYEALKSKGYRNAIEALVAARAIAKHGDTLTVTCSLEQAFKNIGETETIRFVQKQMEENPEIKGDDLGILLEKQFARKKWKSATHRRYGNALIMWVKYLNNTTKI